MPYKIIITGQFTDGKPNAGPFEYTPFHLNLLNAVELTTGLKIAEGKLTELSDRVWEFEFIHRRTGRLAKYTFHRTDEHLRDKYKEDLFGGARKDHRTIKPPSFK